jgi:two-component system, NarL family, nitrate/nitrite response regulator NarL
VKRAVSVALVARDALFGEGLLRILRSTPYRVAATAPTLAELRMPPKCSPGLVVLAPSEESPDWEDVIAEVQRASQMGKVVVVAKVADLATCESLLRAGAAAYLARSITSDVFVKSLDLVAAGEIVISPELVQHLLYAGGRTSASNRTDGGPLLAQPADEIVKRLSLREAEVLHCIVQGDSNKHIGRRFEIAETTVKVHVKSILRKINARNRTQAAIWALNHRGGGVRDGATDSAELSEGSGDFASADLLRYPKIRLPTPAQRLSGVLTHRGFGPNLTDA